MNDENFVRKTRRSIARFIVPQPEHLQRIKNWLPIRVSIAGVMHENRWQAVSELFLIETVQLRREPGNKYDRNAIEVVRGDGKSLGYIHKAIAKILAPFMDKNQLEINAQVTEITSDITGSTFGAGLCFYLPKNIHKRVCSVSHKEIDYCLDISNDGSTVLMINCDEAELSGFVDEFNNHSLKVNRKAACHRLAPNNVQYKWYMVFEKGVVREAIDKYLREERLIIPMQVKAEKKLDEFANSFDSENRDLKQQITNHQNEIKELEGEINRLQSQVESNSKRRSEKWGEEIQAIFNGLIPNIILVRDSLNYLAYEIKDYQSVLRLLGIIAHDPKRMQGKRVENAKDWCEYHFSTGEKDNGRFYYKKEGDKWNVLISEKNLQSQDIHWLRNN